MIINQSAVGMAAQVSRKKSYTNTSERIFACLNTGNMSYYGNSFTASQEETCEEKSFATFQRDILKEKEDSNMPVFKSENYDCLKKTPGFLAKEAYDNAVQDTESGDVEKQEDEIGFLMPKTFFYTTEKQKDSVQNLLRQLRLFLLEFRNNLSILLGKRMAGVDNGAEKNIDLSTGKAMDFGKTVWNRVYYEKSTYEETETMEFSATGKVVTADGRTLDFNVEVGMAREFFAENESLISQTQVIYTDPLVINLDTNPISVSDQKWKFDIDGDGQTDSISLLSKGAGYLVFDKNEDGIINDGTEMFGAKTGNGFEELREYDTDGNGWIDEADEIYSKLKVWVKDDEGNDKQISLKEADVGAIYLGSAATEFALKSMKDNHENAQIRRTGLYLSESGVANSIQQLDMVKDIEKELEKVSA